MVVGVVVFDEEAKHATKALIARMEVGLQSAYFVLWVGAREDVSEVAQILGLFEFELLPIRFFAYIAKQHADDGSSAVVLVFDLVCTDYHVHIWFPSALLLANNPTCPFRCF